MIKFLQHTVNTHTNEAQAGSKALNTACLRCAAVWVRPVQADGRPYSRKSKQCTCMPRTGALAASQLQFQLFRFNFTRHTFYFVQG